MAAYDGGVCGEQVAQTSPEEPKHRRWQPLIPERYAWLPASSRDSSFFLICSLSEFSDMLKFLWSNMSASLMTWHAICVFSLNMLGNVHYP